MGLTSALNTSVNGLSLNETWIDVIGNNIANAGTNGFKQSDVLFTTQLSQTLSVGSAPTSSDGGTDPLQIGLGATIGSINTDFSQGSITTSNSPSDLAIQGDGFFILNSPSGDVYTRDGTFTLNANDQLVNSQGYTVQGYGVDNNFNLVTTQLQSVTVPLGDLNVAQQTSSISIGGSLSPTGTVATQGTQIFSDTLTDAGNSNADATASTLLTNVEDGGTNAGIKAGDVLSFTPDVGGRTLTPATWLIAAGLRYYHMYWMLYISELVAVNMRRKLMNKYLTLNLGFFQNFVRGSGGLISRMLNDIGVIQGGFQKLADAVREPFMMLFSFGYLVYLDWRLTLFVMSGGPIITAVLRKFARSLRKYSKHNQESMEDLTQILKESLDGTRIVQSFNLQDEMRGRFEAQAKDFLHSKGKIISREEASGPVSESLSSVFVALLLIYIGHQIFKSHLDAEYFIAFVAAITFMADSTKKVQGAYIRLQQSAVALERLHGILNETSVVPEIANPKPFPTDWKEIEFRNVSFRYDETEVLTRVNLTVKRGEQVALVGSSGAGKSTMINLLPRFFDPTSGEILIGGVPIDEIRLSDLRANVALVTQDVFLFSDTVERNIWSGDFSKPADGVEPAARLANAHDFISADPLGYHARVGDRGSRFSGGEKQRISIARAIFKNAPILILDEATSALDSESELEVQKGLDSLMQGRTALVIAHRLSTISKCDRIIVMEKGSIIEEGNHNELMVQKGAYHKFFQLQSRL